MARHAFCLFAQVQRDFVRLSQSLQVELEKIRASEREVRWQFDEDVASCSTCSTSFSSPQAKVCAHVPSHLSDRVRGLLHVSYLSMSVECTVCIVNTCLLRCAIGSQRHCLHCGKIFCGSCLARSVAAGPARRAAPVCAVCYTLLVRESTPYFSELAAPPAASTQAPALASDK